jgi:LPXTG-motif cell wall-anchored protein
LRKITTAVLSAVILGGSALTLAPAAQAGTDKVTICHATSAANGGYVSIEVDKNATANGHSGTDHQNGADIIPAYSWVEDKVRHYYPGQNLELVHLIAAGCKAPAAPVTAAPVPPTYVPATCSVPSLPYGRVIVPTDLGDGVASATEPALNPDNTEWAVSYALKDNTEDHTYAWPKDVDGTYAFTVVPLSADPMWVVDSKTGVGQCEMPETGGGISNTALILGGGAIGLGLMFTAATRRRRTA